MSLFSLSGSASFLLYSPVYITFKNFESLYCIPLTYIILYFNYSSIQFKKEKKRKNSAEMGSGPGSSLGECVQQFDTY